MRKIFLLLSVAALAVSCRNNSTLTVNVVNPLNLERVDETVEIPWSKIEDRFGRTEPGKVVVYDCNGERLLSQVLYKGCTMPQSLIFQVHVMPQDNKVYMIKQGKSLISAYDYKVLARLVPERMDDFAWENNRIAYRMYGPALMAKDGPSNGIDVWCKRTEDLIIDKWYEQDLSGKASYHVDHGEGLDCYKVGRTLGCGALAPYIQEQLVLGNNFLLSKILDNGPIRTSFELSYAPLDVDGAPVVEIRRVSLDANAQLNQITQMFVGGKDMPIAAGIVLKNDKKPATAATADPVYKPLLDAENGYVTYAEKADVMKNDTTDNGEIYSAIVFPEGMIDAKVEGQHVLAIGEYKADEPFVYYSGAGWSKAGVGWGNFRFPSEKEWQAYVAEEAQKMKHTLQLRFK